MHVAPLQLDLQAELVDWARERGATVTLDPHFDSVTGQAAAWREPAPLVDAFLPSREEAQEILGAWPGAEAAARGLAELGARSSASSSGPRLAWSIAPPTTGSGTPTREFRTRSTHRCGDAFCGGFLAGWCESDEPAHRRPLRHRVCLVRRVGFGAEHCLVPDRVEARRRLAEREARSL